MNIYIELAANQKQITVAGGHGIVDLVKLKRIIYVYGHDDDEFKQSKTSLADDDMNRQG